MKCCILLLLLGRIDKTKQIWESKILLRDILCDSLLG